MSRPPSPGLPRGPALDRPRPGLRGPARPAALHRPDYLHHRRERHRRAVLYQRLHRHAQRRDALPPHPLPPRLLRGPRSFNSDDERRAAHHPALPRQRLGPRALLHDDGPQAGDGPPLRARSRCCSSSRRRRPPRMSLVPTMANALLNCPDLGKLDVSSLKEIMLGGAAASPELIARMEQAFPCACMAGYGLTESAPVATTARHKGTVTYADDDDRLRHQAMAGWPIPGCEVRVVDLQMNDVPRDMAGHRRSHDARRQHHGRLLQGAQATADVMTGRLVPHRRHGRLGRGELHPHRRPQEGHHHQRRREHLLHRSGARHLRAPGGARMRRRRRARPAVGRSARRVRRPQARRSLTEEELCAHSSRAASPNSKCRDASNSPTRRCPKPAPARSSNASCAKVSGVTGRGYKDNIMWQQNYTPAGAAGDFDPRRGDPDLRPPVDARRLAQAGLDGVPLRPRGGDRSRSRSPYTAMPAPRLVAIVS